jgi:hypothetical protein
MVNNNSQDQLINLAMKELSKVLQDMKQGKTPEMSSTMEKLSAELESVNDKKAKMSEEEIKNFAEKLVKQISKLEE